MNLILAAVIVLTSGVSAYLCCQRLPFARNRALRFIALMVLWAVFLVVPVLVLAALQLANVIQRVTIPGLTWFELAIALAMLGMTRLLPRSAAGQPALAEPTPGNSEPLPAWLLFSAVVVGAAYFVAGANLLTSFPVGSDALAYHLPLAVRWLQEGSLRIPASGDWRFSLPGNGEIMAMLALSSGRQSLAPLFNWASCAVLMTSLYLLIRRWTQCTHTHALVGVLIAASLPPIFFQTYSNYIDLYGTACLLAAVVLFLHRDSPTASERNRLSLSVLAVSALASGISLGTKPIYYVYCGVFFLWVVITLWRERSAHRRPMSALIALVAVAMLLPSAFWFLRGWQSTGNPLYPLQVKVGNHVIWQGYSSSQMNSRESYFKFVRSQPEWLIYPWTEWFRDPGTFPTSYGEGTGAGAAFATFIPLGIAFALYDVRNSYRQRPALYALLLLWFALLAVWFGPFHQAPRFGLPLWVSACIFAVPLFATIEASYPKAIRTLLFLSLASTFAISSLIPLHALASRIAKHRWSRAEVYGYPPAIDDLPAGSRVLNFTGLLEKDFPLAGKNLSNRVVPVFEAPTQQLTQDYLSGQGIDYIVEAAQDPGVGSPPVLPSSIVTVKVDEYKGLGKTWYIYKVVH